MTSSPTDLPPVSAADSEPASATTPTPGLTAHLPEPAPGRRWRLLDRLVVVVFCLGLVVPGLLLALGRRSAEIENRPLLQLPALSVGGLLDPAWYTKIDRALTDNDAVRPYAVRLRGEAYWRLGATGNPAVVRGSGRWLFTRDEIVATCDLSADDVAGALDRTHAAFAAAGQDFRFVLAPDKHAVYPESLDPSSPFGPPCTDARRPAMAAALDARASFAIDGWALLETARTTNPDGPALYYTEDSHWTPTGALLAIRALIESFGPDLWSDADVVDRGLQRKPMELARQIGLRHAESVPVQTIRPSVTLTRTDVPLPFRTTGARSVFRVVASGDRRLLPGVTVVVYDSFFGLNVAAVAPFFQESLWVHQTDLLRHPEIGQLLGPVDRVILDRVERGLYYTHVDDLLRPLVRTGP